MESIAQRIEQEVLSWPKVSAHPHRFGGVEYQVNGHEIGHVHGDQLADLPFPVRVRRELVAAGRASLHHILPDTGWVSYYIRSAADLPGRDRAVSPELRAAGWPRCRARRAPARGRSI
jgi:hypothetical protein